MWANPINFGGIVGGTNTGVNGSSYYTGLSYEARFSNPIIIYGRLYYPLPRGSSGSGGGYVCVDLQTGEQIWWQNYTISPSFASLEWFDSPNQHGVIPNGYLWVTQNVGTNTNPNNVWAAYDAWDGNWLFNVTNVPAGTRAYGPNGEPIIYQIDVANKWLALWNLTNVISNGPANALTSNGYRPVGQVYNSTLRAAYSWNVTIPTLPADSTLRWAINDDILMGSANVKNAFGQAHFGGIGTETATTYATFWTLSLKPESRGTLVWMKDYKAPSGNVTRQLGPVDSVNRVFFMSDKETMQWSGYNLDNGNLMWGPKGDTRDFNYYPTIGSGGVSQVGFVGYGKLYTGGYGGEFLCYDSKTGNLAWKYNNTNSGLETPWGLYPIFPAAIADGKVYVYSNEHSPNSPQYKGSQVRCLNATTGAEIWTLDGWAAVGGFGDQGFPVADGYIAYLNTYDMRVYSVGKGPSALTVNAPNVAATANTPLVISGRVTDTSAGTKQAEQAARFPSGVPAVSDESMGEWMAYVYMQKPMPTNVTGVTVTINALDPNGNYVNLGTTTTDSSGNFGYVWTPPNIPGKYTIIAAFEGSESYFTSSAETFTVVTEAPVATTQPTSQPLSMADVYFVPAIVGLFVAIIVVGLMIMLTLRKRP